MIESQYVTAIIKAINDIGGKAVKFVETEYSEKGTPDIIGCLDYFAFVIEAKLEGNTTSKIQDERLEEWEKVNAIVLVVTYPEWPVKRVIEELQSKRLERSYSYNY